MELLKDTPWELGWFAWRMAPARDVLVVVVKATWSLGGPVAAPAASQRPLCGDVFADDDPTQELLHPSDLAPFKPRGEVIALGSAHAPGEGAARAVAAFRVGRVQRGVVVLGDRAWTALGVPGEPAVFRAMPLSWRRAYGGPGHRGNPVGVGFAPDLTRARRLPAPQIEDPAHPVTRIDEALAPQGLGPIGRAWSPRRERAGTFDDAWLAQRWPAMPDDFSDAYWNGAHPDLVMPFLRGGEPVTLRGVHPEGDLAFTVPRFYVYALGRYHNGVMLPLPMVLDTLVIDVEAMTAGLVYRVSFEQSPPLRVIEARADLGALPRG